MVDEVELPTVGEVPPSVSAAQEPEVQRREAYSAAQNVPSAAHGVQKSGTTLVPPTDERRLRGEAIATVRSPDPFTGRDVYEGIYPPLADLLRTRGVNPCDIQDIVHGAGILPKGPNGEYVSVQNYPEGLCHEIVSRWDSFWALYDKYCGELPF